MSSGLPAVTTAFWLVLLVELPDKTLIATLLLTTRHRPLPVFAGVSVAFAVQCLVAVAFGGALTLLPERVLGAVVATIFGLGALLLLRQGFRGEHDTGRGTAPASTWRRSVLTAFGVLFAAEWGDASQLLTAGLAARYADPIGVGLGAWLALVTVAGLAVLLGDRVRGRIPIRSIQRIAGFAFAAFAAFALVQTVQG
ncbi:MAG: TMEM165/GDT1 family protein [Sciscionella sp.]